MELDSIYLETDTVLELVEYDELSDVLEELESDRDYYTAADFQDILDDSIDDDLADEAWQALLDACAERGYRDLRTALETYRQEA